MEAGEGEGEVAQSCLTLCDLMDCSPSGSFVRGILQSRILEWVAMLSSRGSSQPRDRTRASCVSYIGKQILYRWATREAQHGKRSWHKLLEAHRRGGGWQRNLIKQMLFSKILAPSLLQLFCFGLLSFINLIFLMCKKVLIMLPL